MGEIRTRPSTGMWFFEEKAPIVRASVMAKTDVKRRMEGVLRTCAKSISVHPKVWIERES
jgi:hypothetical protein